MKKMLSLAFSVLAIGLLSTVAHAQRGNLSLRFVVPFGFSVENATFSAGEYEITQPARSILMVRNTQDQTSAFERAQQGHSRNETDDRVRMVFHRYGNEYFFVQVNDAENGSIYQLHQTDLERRLAEERPRPRLIVVSIAAVGTAGKAPDFRK